MDKTDQNLFDVLSIVGAARTKKNKKRGFNVFGNFVVTHTLSFGVSSLHLFQSLSVCSRESEVIFSFVDDVVLKRSSQTSLERDCKERLSTTHSDTTCSDSIHSERRGCSRYGTDRVR
jgi:hypothetical protein